MDTTIYRYVSKAELDGIIINKKLWVSSPLHMNDRLEIKHGIEILHRIASPKGSSIIHQTISTILTQYEDCLERFYNRLFILSMSKHQDELPMWNGYGSSTQTYNVGFKTSELINSAKKQFSDTAQQKKNKNTVEIKECIYLDEDKEDAINSFISDNAALLPENAYEFFLDFIRLCLTFKHKKFHYEQEVRLIIDIEERCITTKKNKRNSCYTNQEQSYFELELSDPMVTHIGIGPTQNDTTEERLSEENIVKTIMQESINTSPNIIQNDIFIVCTEAPYRRGNNELTPSSHTV